MPLEAIIYSLRVILVLIFFTPLQGVTVKPVRCPTNKIAPRRSAYHGVYGSRTFGSFYGLLSPGQPGQQFGQASGLQERPQEDDPDDCGDIEDYDETDLSSLNQPYTHQGPDGNRFFFGGLFQRPGQATTPTTRVPPTYTPLPTSPYWSGGYFGSNNYRPPLQQEPSDYVKPVHDGAQEYQSMYRPDIVGGPLGHVVGHRPVRPTTRPPEHSTATTTKRLHYHTRYPPRNEPAHTRPATDRPRKLNSDGILGSFIDLLLFKK